jgi:hypothetical protein
VQGGRWTGYCGREGEFGMLASSKMGLVSLIGCSEIKSHTFVYVQRVFSWFIISLSVAFLTES